MLATACIKDKNLFFFFERKSLFWWGHTNLEEQHKVIICFDLIYYYVHKLFISLLTKMTTNAKIIIDRLQAVISLSLSLLNGKKICQNGFESTFEWTPLVIMNHLTIATITIKWNQMICLCGGERTFTIQGMLEEATLTFFSLAIELTSPDPFMSDIYMMMKTSFYWISNIEGNEISMK